MKLTHFTNELDQAEEHDQLISLLRSGLECMGEYKTLIIDEKIKDFMVREELLVYAPYWLTEVCINEFPLSKTRNIILANILGSIYITGQDKILDNEAYKILDYSKFSFCSNLLFLDTVMIFMEVFKEYPIFNQYLKKYFQEFTSSSIQEKENHFNKICPYNKAELNLLGQKFAPVKIGVTGTLILGNSMSLIQDCENIIDNYYTAYQLIDDLKDWKEDLALKNYTYFLTTLAGKVNLDENIEFSKPFKDTFEETIRLSISYFEKALLRTQSINSFRFARHIEKIILDTYTFAERNNIFLWEDKKVSISKECVNFSFKGKEYIYNLKNTALVQTDSFSKEVLSYCLDKRSEEILAKFNEENKESAKEVIDTLVKYNFLSYLDKFPSNSIKVKNEPEPIMHLDLGLGSESDLNRFIDILFLHCVNNKMKEIVLIVDEPIQVNIKNIIEEIRNKAYVRNQDIFIQIYIENISHINISIIFSCNADSYAFQIESEDDIKILLNASKKYDVIDKTKLIVSNNLEYFKNSPSQDIYLFSTCCLFDVNQQTKLKHSYIGINNLYNEELSLRLKGRKLNCNAGVSSIFISGNDGKLYPCYWHRNLYPDAKPFSQETLRNMQVEFLLKSKNEKCIRCNIYQLCRGGCYFSEPDFIFCDTIKTDLYKKILKQ